MDSLYERSRKGNYPYFYIMIFFVSHTLISYFGSSDVLAAVGALAVMVAFIGGDILKILADNSEKP